jgi:oxygen-dependent protoporphyrinogen oxidase
MTSSSITAVSVGVVNLFYSSPNLLPVSGFGYLIPQSIPFEQNPELALGVVFDSDAVQGQDTTPGTKLTVMLGGHWWDKFGRLPSARECRELAMSVVRRHLNIKDEPAVLDAIVNSRCIPQYPVNYRRDYLRRDHEHLLKAFYGRVKVAGAYFNGVGVNDCVRGAMDVVESALSPDWRDKTGLEVISRSPEFAKLEPSRNRGAQMKR